MECIRTVSHSLIVNDEPPGLIRPSRGIRQGDPLSPCIFIMCMEVLSTTLIAKANQSQSGLGIKLSAGGNVSLASYLRMIGYYSVKRIRVVVPS